jgi:hypothetical protein
VYCDVPVSKEIGALLEQIGAVYTEGVKEYWWHA